MFEAQLSLLGKTQHWLSTLGRQYFLFIKHLDFFSVYYV